MKPIPITGESSKAFERRMREGFYYDYLQGNVIDIGYGKDPVTPDCERWDTSQGDAALMEGVPDNSFDSVYCSHVLEHIAEPETALKNWLRILNPGGYLIVTVPSMMHYEKRETLPSRYNPDHKTYWIIGRGRGGHIRGLLETVQRAIGEKVDILSLRTLLEGYFNAGPSIHSGGEYSLEIIARKL